MITLEKMRWGWLFSYGDNNEIDFVKSPLTQILGLNGHGKSSIALILEEALYNKNSKGIKKADILNRNSSSKSYWIELDFNKDGDSYSIKTTRSSTQNVKLLKNGDDISGHTATSTYKMIEDIIGFDHKAFGQIVYQSSAASLEFLTATDSNRKKFLIDLLNLSRYVETADTIKEVVKEVSNEILVAETKIKSQTDWLNKYKNSDLNPKTVKTVPESPRELIEEISSIKEQISAIDTTNKKIAQNNKYKELMESSPVYNLGEKPDTDNSEHKVERIELVKVSRDAEAFVQKMKKLGSLCPTCMQDIDTAKVNSIISEQTAIKTNADTRIKELDSIIKELDTLAADWKKKEESNELYEKYYSLYDPKMQQTFLEKTDLESLIAKNEELIKSINDEIKTITEYNSKALAHNAKIDLVKNQLQDAQLLLEELGIQLTEAKDRNNILQILVKTFSPTGLIAYKIECLIKDLEEVTNKYLAELSGGRFQIGFKIAQSDKLNVVITDNGKDIDIVALSGGERARVNAAALLGIRKLLQSLSNSRINLLILDETIENLDLEGKEKLVEVLLQEEHLNTFVISHGFSHPLLEKLTVVKTKNISRIE